LLPFINVEDLKSAIAKQCPDDKLTALERTRNRFGTALAFRYDASSTDKVECPVPNIGLGAIDPCFSSYSPVEEEELELSGRLSFEPKLIAGTKIPFPGFPSLNVLPITSVDFVSIGLNCFGTPSKYATCVLSLAQMPELPPLAQLAQTVLGRSLFVNWPMMHEGRVVAMSDETHEVRLVKGKGVQTQRLTEHSELSAEQWQTETEAMQQMYHTGDGSPGSGGVNVGKIKIRLKLLPLQGMKTNPANGSTKKVFGREEADVPLQLALWQAPAPDPRFQERGPLGLADRFPVDSNVILLKGKYGGCKGEVVGILDKKLVGVKVQAMPVEIPFGLALARTVQESYISSNDAARILKIHPGLLGKITGRISFDPGRYDLGLNLKSPDGLCVIGYTRQKVTTAPKKKNKDDAWLAGDSLRVIGSKREDEEGGNGERIIWEYTPKAIRLIEAYRTTFPQLFAGLSKFPHEKKYDANQIFGPNGTAWLPVIRDWLNKLDSAKLPRSPVSTQSMSHEAVAAVQKAADVRTLALKKRGYPKDIFIKVPGTALYREASTAATDIMVTTLDPKEGIPQLGDRIVNLAADGIPFGLRGTVVAIHEAGSTGCVEVVMDAEFMGGNSLQGMCSKFRGKLCPWSRLLKVAPEDSKKVVDKLVPRGSGQAAVDKIISSIDPAANAQPGSAQPATAVSRSASAPPKPQKPAANKTPPKAKQRSQTPNSASSSRGGGKQAGWREAKGPVENKTGFKWKKGERRAGKNGLAQWRNYVQTNAAKKEQQNAALQLKAVLGVNTAPPPKAASQATQASSTNQLKAVLGVNAVPAPAPPQPTSTGPNDAVNSLKSVLGVTPLSNGAPAAAMAPASPPPPASAADKLLAMMSQTGPPPPPNPPFIPPPQGVVPPMPFPPPPGAGMPPPPPSSNFNFTYVDESSAMPAVPPPMMMYPPVPPPPPAAAYGMMMMQPPPPHHMPMQQQQPPMPPPLAQLAVDQFPPLGATPPDNGDTKTPAQQQPPTVESPPAPEPEVVKAAAKPVNEMSMVPSVVVRR